MTWALAAQLIAQYGVPFVEDLITKIESNANVTSADFVTLRGLMSNNAKTTMAAQLAAAGILSTDPKYAAFMALVS